MTFHTLVLGACFLFVGFTFEHLPMPDLLLWFQPLWILLVVTLLVLNAPHLFGLWLAIPAGLMMDAEQGTLLGTHVVTLAIHIFAIQYFYKRIAAFNMVQQIAMVAVLALAHQVLRFWASQVIVEWPHPVELVAPSLLSALVWPWLAGLGNTLLRRLIP